jgi:hypothetical protein
MLQNNRQRQISLHTAAILGLEIKMFRLLLDEAEAAAGCTGALKKLVNAQDQVMQCSMCDEPAAAAAAAAAASDPC